MKVALAIGSILAGNILFILLADLVLGDTVMESFHNMVSSFQSMEAGEYVVICLFFLFVIGQQLWIIHKAKASKANKSS